MISPSRRLLWYLAAIVLVIFAFKTPVIAGHLAHMAVDLLSAAASALAKLVGAL